MSHQQSLVIIGKEILV